MMKTLAILLLLLTSNAYGQINHLTDSVDHFLEVHNIASEDLLELEIIRSDSSLNESEKEKKWNNLHNKIDPTNDFAKIDVRQWFLYANEDVDKFIWWMNNFKGYSHDFLKKQIEFQFSKKKITELNRAFLLNTLHFQQDESIQELTPDLNHIAQKMTEHDSTTFSYSDFELMKKYKWKSGIDYAESFQNICKQISKISNDELDSFIDFMNSEGIYLTKLTSNPNINTYKIDKYVYTSGLGSYFSRFLHKVSYMYTLIKLRRPEGQYNNPVHFWTDIDYAMYQPLLQNDTVKTYLIGQYVVDRWRSREIEIFNASKTNLSLIPKLSTHSIWDCMSFIEGELLKTINEEIDSQYQEGVCPVGQILQMTEQKKFIIQKTSTEDGVLRNINTIEIPLFDLTENQKKLILGMNLNEGLNSSAKKIAQNKSLVETWDKDYTFRYILYLKYLQLAQIQQKKQG